MKKKSKKVKKKIINFKPLKKNVKLVDIANRVGVAISTVSRVLNGNPGSIRVTNKTKNEILRVAAELGYASYHIPTKYHKGVRSIMVISHDPDEIFYQKIIRYMERTLRSKDYACYFSYTEDDPKQASKLIDEMGERFISGCVVFQKDKEVFTEENELKLRNLGIPCVVIDRHPLPCPDFISTVELDHKHAGYDAASYLLRLGHSRFAFLNVPNMTSSCIERQEGVQKCLTEAGLSLDSKYIAKVSPEARYKLFEYFSSWATKRKDFPTAIIAVHDELGYAALNILESMGIKVPEDVSIVGFDDRVAMVPWGLDNVKLPLTSIRQPIESIGIAAGNELIERINYPDRAPEHIRLKGELMVRSSTATRCTKLF